MVDKTTSQENLGVAIQNVDTFRAVQNAGNVKFTFTLVKAWILGWITAVHISFLQNGVGGVLVTLDLLLRGKIFIPEMYGAISYPLGTPAGDVVNTNVAQQACYNAAKAAGGGIVQYGRGVYGCAGVVMDTSNVRLQGAGCSATVLLHILTGPSSCIVMSAGAGILSNTAVTNLSICSNDIVFNKIGINVLDVSCCEFRNLFIGHYPVDGTMYRGAGGIGTGMVISGREHGWAENVQIYANTPMQISVNPNSPISIDSWTFRNMLLCTTLATSHCIVVDLNVNLFNVTFDGAQNWIGGKDGFHWIDGASTQISQGLYINGVKSEQCADTTGYTVNIQHNFGLHTFKLENGMGGDRNGVLLRKTIHAKLENFFFNGGGLFVGLNIDGTNKLVSVENCSWTAGATATIVGMTRVFSAGLVTGMSAALPSTAIWTVTGSGLASLNDASIDNVAWTAYAPVLASEAGGAIGAGNVITGFYKTIGKHTSVRAKAVIGAAGIGAATQISLSLPVIAVGDNMLIAKDKIVTGLGGTGDIGIVGQTKALLATSGGASMANNNTTIVMQGTYESV